MRQGKSKNKVSKEQRENDLKLRDAQTMDEQMWKQEMKGQRVKMGVKTSQGGNRPTYAHADSRLVKKTKGE